MTNDPGAQPAETSLPGEPEAALPARLQALAGTFTPAPWSPEVYGLTGPLGVGARSKNILFIAWRDLANRRAGGSEVLVDRLASGMLARGHRVTLLCGGEVAERPYRVVRNGGTYSQFLRAPLAYLRNFRNSDLIVEVCNGMPYLSPLWCRRPSALPGEPRPHRPLVDAVPPAGVHHRPEHRAEGHALGAPQEPVPHRVYVHGGGAAADGVGEDRIRQICNGVEEPDPPAPRSPEPLFLAIGRLTDYKRLDLLLRLWDRVRHVVGGKLVIAGDGPQRPRLEALAGPGVVFTGRVSEQEKHRLLCAAWLLMHPALIEGWGSWSPRRRSADPGGGVRRARAA